MTLSPADIEALASAIVRKMRKEEELRLDHEYEASLPVEEQKRLAKARMREYDRQKKAKQSVK